ncbi:hypothetical protein G6549_27125 [Bacillus sp. MM2020_1]|nr:hypothetical protein [Bacillus sp. MM2020_1]
MNLNQKAIELLEENNYHESFLEEGKTEIGYARAEKAMRMSRDEIDETVKAMYANMKNTIL